MPRKPKTETVVLKKINNGQRYAVIGFITMLIQRRRDLDSAEKVCADYLRELGAEDSNEPSGMQILDWVGEAVCNQGDDPERAAEELLEHLDMEVAE